MVRSAKPPNLCYFSTSNHESTHWFDQSVWTCRWGSGWGKHTNGYTSQCIEGQLYKRNGMTLQKTS